MENFFIISLFSFVLFATALGQQMCPPVCMMYCQYGNVMVNGCPICQCNPAPQPVDPCATVRCGRGEICKVIQNVGTCVREECPSLPGDLGRPAVCNSQCSNHTGCSGDQICCTLDACSTQCMSPAPQCPVFRCAPCPNPGDFRTIDQNGCQTCTCTSTQPTCRQCICPVGKRPRRGFVGVTGCPRCECETANPSPEPKPGNCPAIPPGTFGICVTECSSDSECTGARKCCRNGCGQTCQEPQGSSLSCATMTCERDEICKMVQGAPMCVREACPRLPGVIRATVCSNDCGNHTDCSGNQICCSFSACATTCMTPVDRYQCPTPMCLPCPPSRPYLSYDQEGCLTCNCVNSQNIVCRECTCPVGKIRRIGGIDETGCPTCNCEEPDPCSLTRCGPGEKCEVQTIYCVTTPCPPPRAQCVPDPGVPQPKPGSCPTPTVGICIYPPTCGSDGDCPGTRKCCHDGCTRTCQEPQGTSPSCATTRCSQNQICKMVQGTPTCVREECPSQPAGLIRPAVCNSQCSNHTDCPGDQLCCSLDACSTQCMSPAPQCPVFLCQACPNPGDFMEIDQNGCQTCTCTSTRPACRQCICPVGKRPRRGFVDVTGCPRCECETANPTPRPKPGSCPAIPPGTGGVCGPSTIYCTSDSRCPGAKKCCLGACGMTCQDPQGAPVPEPKPGNCPVVAFGTGGFCFTECSSDSECPGARKCCSSGCGLRCQDPQPSPSCATMRCSRNQICKMVQGTPTCIREECPSQPAGLIRPAVCDSQCSNHTDCPGDQLCCSLDACSTQCMSPAPQCPVFRCLPCSSNERYMDIDQNGCQTCTCTNTRPTCRECICPVGKRPRRGFVDVTGCPRCECETVNPTPQPKPGNCPAVAPGTVGICVTECSSDSECPGAKKCCRNGCGQTCQEPANNASPCQNPPCGPGERCELVTINCFVAPCPPPYAMCVPDRTILVQPPQPPQPPVRTESTCSRLSCDSTEECKMMETTCPPGSNYFECQGDPVARCFSKNIACPEWGCPNYCPHGYLVDDSGCKTRSCTCAPADRPTCETHTCGQGEHCEMLYTQPCMQDASCWRSPVCVADGTSTANCEMSRNSGVTDNTPVLYYLPRDGCPSGSKLIYMSNDGTELCCRSEAIHSDKPACQNGAPLFQFPCSGNTASGTPNLFERIFGRSSLSTSPCVNAGKTCTQHINGEWNVCCEPLQVQPFRFNSRPVF